MIRCLRAHAEGEDPDAGERARDLERRSHVPCVGLCSRGGTVRLALRRGRAAVSVRASASGTSSTIRSSAVEKTLPCASVLSESVPPPSSAPCSRKFSALRFGSSKRSTSPSIDAAEMRGDALERELSREQRIPLRTQRDHADVGGVALVARARVRDVDEADLHATISTAVRDDASCRSSAGQ